MKGPEIRRLAGWEHPKGVSEAESTCRGTGIGGGRTTLQKESKGEGPAGVGGSDFILNAMQIHQKNSSKFDLFLKGNFGRCLKIGLEWSKLEQRGLI